MKYSKAMSLNFHLTDYTRMEKVNLNVLDDVATMEVRDRHLATDAISSKLVYFVKGDGGGDIVALQGDRGPSEAMGLKGDSGDRGPAGSRGPTGKRGVEGSPGPPGKIGKMDLLEHVVEL